MEIKSYATNLIDLEEERTSHGTTDKWVLKRNGDLDNALTQIAFGKFEVGESCPKHAHATMDEYFFIQAGKGTYKVGEETISLHPQTLVEVPAGVEHQLFADKGSILEFIYWGVAKEM